MLELLGKAFSKIIGGTTRDGESQVLNLVAEAFRGDEAKLQAWKIEMEKLYQERIEGELKDRMDAREMQMMAYKQGDSFSKRFVHYLSALIILGAIVANIAPIFIEIPEASQIAVNKAMDFFNYVSAGVIAFYFGARSLKKAE